MPLASRHHNVSISVQRLPKSDRYYNNEHYHHHHHHILFPPQYGNNMYRAITYRIIEMAGCQKSKCSSSWPPIITFICSVNNQTFIPIFTQTHSIPIQTSKKAQIILLCIMQENFSRFTVVYCNPTIIMNQLVSWEVLRQTIAYKATLPRKEQHWTDYEFSRT